MAARGLDIKDIRYVKSLIFWSYDVFQSSFSYLMFLSSDISLPKLSFRVVINYDFPTGVEDYVHRIGRTGRAGVTGLAHTFLSNQDANYAPDLIKVLEWVNQRVPP